jgi:hypothetical protein
MDISEIATWKWLIIPTIAFAGWTANQYVNGLVAQEIAPVKTAVVQMVELQREVVNDQKFDSCMQYKYQNDTFERRVDRCNDEKVARRIYWAWENCMKSVKEKDLDPTTCGRQPEWID